MAASSGSMSLTSAALCATAGVVSLFLVAASMSGGSSPTTPSDAGSDESFISPEDVKKVFDDLFLQMQGVLAQLSQQLQQIQMSGQMIPEKELRKILTAEFERALLSLQKKIFEDHGVDADCIAEATWEFLAEPEKYPFVKSSVERFQKLYENVSGESVVGRRPGDGGGSTDRSVKTETLSKEKLLEVAVVYFDALTAAMKGIVDRLKDEKKNLRDRAVTQALHMEFASVANDRGEAALKKKGVSLDVFRASMEKHASDPEVQRTLTMLQMKQQQDLLAMGVPGM